MVKYSGLIKNKVQALAIAKKLRANGGDKAIGAAVMLERNWHSIASRPAIHAEIIGMLS